MWTLLAEIASWIFVVSFSSIVFFSSFLAVFISNTEFQEFGIETVEKRSAAETDVNLLRITQNGRNQKLFREPAIELLGLQLVFREQASYLKSIVFWDR